ncbi:MAG: hypothetical protein ACJA01_003867, partial [Saprospiraceae bacterium]
LCRIFDSALNDSFFFRFLQTKNRMKFSPSSLPAFGHGQKQVGCSYSYDNSKLLHLLVEFKSEKSTRSIFNREKYEESCLE